MALQQFEQTIRLRSPREAVFRFFADARNLECITPPWLRFAILTPGPVDMREGTRIDYRLRLHGIPIRWQSEISVWDPPHRFVDRQTQGPYRTWIHEHRFIEDGDHTLVVDHVQYRVLGGPLVQRFLVAPDLERIFRYRRLRLAEHFGETPVVRPADVRDRLVKVSADAS